MMNKGFILPIEFGTPEYDEAIRLRYLLLRKPLGMEYNEAQLEEEFDQVHFGYYDLQNNLRACLTFQCHGNKVLKMRQVAVDDSCQNSGIGSALVRYSEVWAKDAGFELIMLHARDTAVKFYEKLDYNKKGKPFTEVGILHYLMEKKLK